MTKGLFLRNISIKVNGQRLLDLNRDVLPGHVLAVMGPSGSGKSTLLSFITGTRSRQIEASGEVWLDGRNVTGLPPEERRIGLLFQDDLLFPHLSVGANLGFGLRPGGTRRERKDKIDAALASVGLAGFATRDPATLSGGQRLRVSLMRMLLAEPRALLLDEPFSRLDADLRKQVRDLVFAEARARDLPVVLVTHDLEDAEAAGGDIITLGD